MPHYSASTICVVRNYTEPIIAVIWKSKVIPRDSLGISIHNNLKGTLSMEDSCITFTATKEEAVFLSHPDNHVLH